MVFKMSGGRDSWKDQNLSKLNQNFICVISINKIIFVIKSCEFHLLAQTIGSNRPTVFLTIYNLNASSPLKLRWLIMSHHYDMQDSYLYCVNYRVVSINSWFTHLARLSYTFHSKCRSNSMAHTCIIK